MKRLVALAALTAAALTVPSAAHASSANASANACHGQFVSGVVQSLAGSGTSLNDLAQSLGYSSAGMLHQSLKDGTSGIPGGC